MSKSSKRNFEPIETSELRSEIRIFGTDGEEDVGFYFTREANFLFTERKTTEVAMFLSFLRRYVLGLLVLVQGLWAQTDTLRLLFAGDIMGHAAQIKSAEVAPGEYDYRPCFRYIRSTLKKADIAVGNLELTLPGQPPYSGYPMFRSPDALAVALRDAGFDVLVTANNHSNDARGPGVVSTIETLRRLGFQQTGTFKDRRERALFYPLMLYQNGFKLALLNYTYGTNGIPTEPPTVVNLLDTVQIAADLAEARARRPHFIIAFVHWGSEYQSEENTEQRRLAHFFIRHGADLVVGAHPHVVQPIKVESVTLPDGGQRSAVVAYSLGNFISNQQKPGTDGGIILGVELLLREGASCAEMGRYGYLPVWRYVHREATGKTTFFVLPAGTDPPSDLKMPREAELRRQRFLERTRVHLSKVAEWDAASF